MLSFNYPYVVGYQPPRSFARVKVEINIIEI